MYIYELIWLTLALSVVNIIFTTFQGMTLCLEIWYQLNTLSSKCMNSNSNAPTHYLQGYIVFS